MAITRCRLGGESVRNPAVALRKMGNVEKEACLACRTDLAKERRGWR